jgi:hypothetical protein
MLIFMNSSMMPADGIFIRSTITAKEAKRVFQQYKNDYISYIGYPNACRVASEYFETQIALNRDKTVIKDGDFILIMSLKYRLTNTADKKTRKHGNTLSDYCFYAVQYRSKGYVVEPSECKS